MVLEYLSYGLFWLNSNLNNFFGQHIVFISHMLAAVTLMLTETTLNRNFITPILDTIEERFLWNIPLLPSLVTAVVFIFWATFSIFLYDLLFRFIFERYPQHMTLILFVFLVFVMIGSNMKYREA